MVNVYIADGNDWRVKVHAEADLDTMMRVARGALTPNMVAGVCVCVCVWVFVPFFGVITHSTRSH